MLAAYSDDMCPIDRFSRVSRCSSLGNLHAVRMARPGTPTRETHTASQQDVADAVVFVVCRDGVPRLVDAETALPCVVRPLNRGSEKAGRSTAPNVCPKLCNRGCFTRCPGPSR